MHVQERRYRKDQMHHLKGPPPVPNFLSDLARSARLGGCSDAGQRRAARLGSFQGQATARRTGLATPPAKTSHGASQSSASRIPVHGAVGLGLGEPFAE